MLAAAVVLGTGIAVPAASFADLAGGCDFAPTGTTPNCAGPLTGSTFEGGDGNLLINTTGHTDWAKAANSTDPGVAGLNPAFDLPSGSTDNSFGQGTKEDDPNVTVVTGSIPNNKSDLTRFYEASELSGVNSHNFLYLAWERANSLGTANFDFEINQKTQPDLTKTGPATLNRTAGDLLVTFDFTNGGGKPAIGILRWLTSATVPAVPGFATNACFSAKSFPCWGDQKTLDGTDSIGAVNNLDAVTDPLFPNSANPQNPVPALQFGETAIDLTTAGVFPPGTCEAFGSAFVRSRSSASFTAEIKDFIAPIPVNISNCGSLGITKVSSKNNAPVAGATFSIKDSNGNEVPGGPFTSDANGKVCVNNLVAGSYTVTETAAPTGYAKDTSTKTASVTTSSTCDNTNVTFTDTPLTDVTVTSSSEVTGSGGTTSTITCTPTGSTANIPGSPQTGQKATVTSDGLLPGSYTCTVMIDP